MSRSAPVGDAIYRTLRIAAIGAVVLYSVGFMLWYGATPLGRAPVLDGREILELAASIADGSLAHEPFYRAPLYSALLAAALRLGVDAAWLPALARAINLAAHLGAALACAGIARRLGGDRWAALLAFALWGVYPVALHLAGDPLDMTLGNALMLAGVYALLGFIAALSAEQDRAAWRLAIAAGLALALAALVRPNLVVMAPAAAALALWVCRRDPARLRANVFPAIGAAACLFAASCAINWSWSGRAWLMPWQGAYALWAANRPGSNGRTYVQEVEIRNVDHQVNGTRLESEELYRRETGARDPLDPAVTSAYWNARFAGYVRAHPLEWAKLLLLRAGYLSSNDEQYDNKTYAFHREQSPWLRWNPLGFGVLMTLAAVTVTRRWRDPVLRRYLWLVAAYTAGLMLYFVHDRFRLPLAALLTPLAALAPGCVLEARRSRTLALAMLVAAALVAVLAYTPRPGAPIDATFADDLMLSAQAAGDVGRYDESESLALRALERAPQRSFAWEILCTARYNRMLAALPGRAVDAEVDRAGASACLDGNVRADQAHALGAVFLWRLGRPAEALEIWRAIAASESPARFDARAFVLLADATAADAAADTTGYDPQRAPLLNLARAIRGDPAAIARLSPATDIARERARFAALLP